MRNTTVQLAEGVNVPVVGFGTWQLTGEKAYRAVGDALSLGYRHIDTAQLYGNEREVGRATSDSGIDRILTFRFISRERNFRMRSGKYYA